MSSRFSLATQFLVQCLIRPMKLILKNPLKRINLPMESHHRRRHLLTAFQLSNKRKINRYQLLCSLRKIYWGRVSCMSNSAKRLIAVNFNRTNNASIVVCVCVDLSVSVALLISLDKRRKCVGNFICCLTTDLEMLQQNVIWGKIFPQTIKRSIFLGKKGNK